MISEKTFSSHTMYRLLFLGSRINREKIGNFEFLMARDALDFILDSLGFGTKNNVLFPAYTCEEPFVPFLTKGCKVTFYDIRYDKGVDIEYIERLIVDDKIDTLFWINYFGIVSSLLKDISDICKRHSVLLIEDCSHSFLTEGSGAFGDLVFYSYRKLLPVPDGGTFESQLLESVPSFNTRLFSNISALSIILKSIKPLKNFDINRATIARKYLQKRKPQIQSKKKYLPISSLSEELLKRIDLGDIIDKRRRNFFLWNKMLEDVKVHRIIKELPQNTCPVGFPILIKDRNRVVNELKSKNIYLKIDWRLPREVNREFEGARFLSRNSVTLPVHPWVTEEIVQRIKSEIITILGRDWWNEED